MNWLLRKLANVQAERERVGAQYKTLLESLDSEEKSLHWRFENDLKAFVTLQLAEAAIGARACTCYKERWLSAPSRQP